MDVCIERALLRNCDVRSVIQFAVQFWMLASPLAYSSSLVPQCWRALCGLNPMAGVIDGFWWPLTSPDQPPLPSMLVSGTIGHRPSHHRAFASTEIR